MWIIFKVVIEFATILLLLYVFFGFFSLVFWLWGMWDPSCPTRDWTCNPGIGRWSPITGPPGKSPNNLVIGPNSSIWLTKPEWWWPLSVSQFHLIPLSVVSWSHLYLLMRWLCAGLSNFAFSDTMLIALSWPWWKYLHLGNWEMLQIKIFLFFSQRVSC